MRLHRRARLKFDRVRSIWLLLYPEGGMVLNRTALEIATLCQHSITRTELMTTLYSRYPGAPRKALDEDADGLLAQLESCGLLEHDGATLEVP